MTESNTKQTTLARMKTPFALLFLSATVGAVVKTYSSALSKNSNEIGVDTLVRGDMERRQLAMDDEEWDKRVMMMTQTVWPECAKNRLDAVQCKNFIDEMILSEYTGDDRLTRTLIMPKRRSLEEWYNSVVIYMDDDDMVLGRNGDGLIWYDFEWIGGGRRATEAEERDCCPVIATETAEGRPGANLGEASNPKSKKYNPMIFERRPILVMCKSVREAREDPENTNPIQGGVVIPEDLNNTPEAQQRLADALTEYDDPTKVVKEGSRLLEPFDCSGMNGYTCCLYIKAIVNDADIYNKAIQCHLNFIETSYKAKHFFNNRGQKVHIFANHNFMVNRDPYVQGSFPGGMTGAELEAWVAAGYTDGY